MWHRKLLVVLPARPQQCVIDEPADECEQVMALAKQLEPLPTGCAVSRHQNKLQAPHGARHHSAIWNARSMHDPCGSSSRARST